jgi:alpha-glucosidase
MMQFSVAPWRVLSADNLQAVKKAVATRAEFVPVIMELARRSAVSGEPIVRNMEYVFPKQGLQTCKDQFMLGDSILVAPMVKEGLHRTVIFPKGNWKGDDGKIVKGPATKQIEVPMDRLPWYKLVSTKR